MHLPVADNIKNTESTLSSWIYSEVEMTRYLREKKPQRKGYRYPINAGFQLEHSELKIKNCQPTNNGSNITIAIPKDNILSCENLKKLMIKV